MAGLATGRSQETGLAFNWTFMDLIRRRLFGAPRGRDGELRAEQPLRSELLSVDQLRQHARTIASSHEIDKRFGPDRLLPRLAENEVALLHAYEAVSDAVKQDVRIAPAADWLLDNFHLIEEQIRTARRHLPRTYSGELPRLAIGPLAGYPRVYAIALELISHGDGRVDAESLSGFVASYQAITTLKLGELWAIPTMLRLALLENLRRIAIRIATCRRIAPPRTSGPTACWRLLKRSRRSWCWPWPTWSARARHSQVHSLRNSLVGCVARIQA